VSVRASRICEVARSLMSDVTGRHVAVRKRPSADDILCTNTEEICLLFSRFGTINLNKYTRLTVASLRLRKFLSIATLAMSALHTVPCCRCTFTFAPSWRHSPILGYFFPLPCLLFRELTRCDRRPLWSSSKLCLGLGFSKLYFFSQDGAPVAGGGTAGAAGTLMCVWL
jgi:hypothetical protein